VAVEVSVEQRSACPQCKAVFRGGFLRCPRDGSPLHELVQDPLIDTVLADRYQIESLIGEGGIGRVYRARHVRMSRRYAIKIPFGELAYDIKVRQRFANEAEAASRLRHPNVIGVVDVGETSSGLLYLAMDLAEGISLAEEIERTGPFPPERARRIALQIALGLEHAHERALVHRDLKPENVILEHDADGLDAVRIVDFGIAILRDAQGERVSGRLTTEGIVLGTPHYMAPEQAINGEIDHRVDVFALGLILYEMLAGVLPFSGSPVDVARQNLSAEPPRISQRIPGLKPDPLLEALAFRMMQKRPADRPQFLREVVSLLELIGQDPSRAATMLGAVAPAPSVPSPSVPAMPAVAEKRVTVERDPLTTERTEADGGKRRLVIVFAVIALLLGALVVFLLTRGGDGERQATAPLDAARAIDAPVVVPVDAAVVDAAPEVDAIVAVDAGARPPRDAGSKKAPDAGVKRPPPDAAVARPAPDAGVEAPPSKASLTALYEQVGAAIKTLLDRKGAEVVKPYKRRYDEISYLDAVRNPDIRVEVMKKLRALDRDIKKALQ
jgi:serine/threonine-protein kinase